LAVLVRISRPGFISSEYRTFCSGSTLFVCEVSKTAEGDIASKRVAPCHDHVVVVVVVPNGLGLGSDAREDDRGLACRIVHLNNSLVNSS
jgi:hypothetical protein